MPETTGLVQRLKWVDGSRAVLVHLGPLPTAVQLFQLSLEGTDPAELATRRALAHLLTKAFAAGFPVTVSHEANSAVVTGADVRYAAVRPDGIEVTQAIQDLTHSVTLIARKATVVRVYLSCRSSSPVTVRGELTVQRLPGGTAVTLSSLNTVVLDPAQFGQVDAQRRDVNRSLNSLLPVDQTVEGQLEVRLTGITDATTGTPLDPGLITFTTTVRFTEAPPLRLRILGISYQQGNPPVTHVPSALDFGLIPSWLQRAYPVAQVFSSQAIVTANVPAPFDCGQINAQVAAIRSLDMAGGGIDQRTHYFGLVSDAGFFMRGCSAVPGSPDPSAVGSGPTGPGTWGWDFDGSYGDWYTGHELGHTFGRLHPGFCGESHDDPNYPFAGGQLANADDAFVGFDVGDPVYNLPMAALPGDQWHDVMTYCNTQWLSSYTYEGIRTRLAAEDALGPGPSPGPGLGTGGAGRPDERFPAQPVGAPKAAAVRQHLISVVATVNLTIAQGKIQFVNPLPGGAVTRPEPGSPVALRVQRGDGQVIQEYPVPVKLLSDSEQERRALVDAVIAVGPDAQAIELAVAGRPADTFRRSARPPAVRNLKRDEAARDALSLTWETDAQPGDRHTYIIQASTDNGATWQTLAVGLASPQVAIDRSQFRGLKHVLVRVIATDGFTRSETTSELLSMD